VYFFRKTVNCSKSDKLLLCVMSDIVLKNEKDAQVIVVMFITVSGQKVLYRAILPRLHDQAGSTSCYM